MPIITREADIRYACLLVCRALHDYMLIPDTVFLQRVKDSVSDLVSKDPYADVSRRVCDEFYNYILPHAGFFNMADFDNLSFALRFLPGSKVRAYLDDETVVAFVFDGTIVSGGTSRGGRWFQEAHYIECT